MISTEIKKLKTTIVRSAFLNTLYSCSLLMNSASTDSNCYVGDRLSLVRASLLLTKSSCSHSETQIVKETVQEGVTIPVTLTTSKVDLSRTSPPI